jgi:SAM-dependent methyltransferase
MSQSSGIPLNKSFAPQQPYPLPSRADCLFYHSMDFPNGESVTGHWDLRRHFEQYIGHYPLGGKSVLDIGTASGFLAFSAEARGAQVTAYDAAYSWGYDRIPFRDAAPFRDRAAWAKLEDLTFLKPLKNGFWYAWHKLNSKIEVVYAPLHDLAYWDRRFDVVVAGAFVCHLADPVSAIGALGRLAAEAFIIAFEDVLATDELTMQAANDWSNATYDYTWWLLSRGLYRRVFENVGFRIDLVPCMAIHNPTGYNNLQTPVQFSKTTIIATRIH